MNIHILPKKILIRIFCFIIFLLSMNIAGIIASLNGYGTALGLVPFFNFDLEQNIPAFYSAVTLLVASILLTVIALFFQSQKKFYWEWFGLGVIFSILAVDEATSLHERNVLSMQELLKNMNVDTSGILHFAWVIPYGILVLCLGLIYLRFLTKLPKYTRNLFLFSGFLFVVGALGFELIGGALYAESGKSNLIYHISYTCEESLEMSGIAIFIYALLDYISTHIKEVKFSTKPSKNIKK